jgi:hypothetical protein
VSTLWDLVHRNPLPEGVTLSKTEAVDVTAVLKFYGESEDDHVVVPSELPNIAPPFEKVFMFGRMPRIFRANGTTAENSSSGSMGCLIHSEKRQDGWRSELLLCVGDAAELSWQPFVCSIDIQSDGRLARLGGGKDFRLTFPTSLSRAAQARLGDDGETVADQLASLYQPFLLATALMHCKNVTATRVSIPSKLLRAAEKRGRARYSYSVLEIAPMRSALQGEGGLTNGNGLGRALHICRGHFKDYRDGSGLFGKHRAIYWWDQATRGSVEHGVHVKDYRIPVGAIQ